MCVCGGGGGGEITWFLSADTYMHAITEVISNLHIESFKSIDMLCCCFLHKLPRSKKQNKTTVTCGSVRPLALYLLEKNKIGRKLILHNKDDREAEVECRLQKKNIGIAISFFFTDLFIYLLIYFFPSDVFFFWKYLGTPGSFFLYIANLESYI